MPSRPMAAAVGVLAVFAALTACSRPAAPPAAKPGATVPVPSFKVPYPIDETGSTIAFPTPSTRPDQTIDLKAAACPDPIVVQASGPPGPSQLELFRLAGPEGTVARASYRAPLLDPTTGAETGVSIEIRNGGEDVADEPPNALLARDPTVFAAQVSTDDAIVDAGRYPSVAVAALRERSPLLIFWDEATYPTAVAIPDLRLLGAKVRYEPQAAFMDYLTTTDVLAAADVDPSYDGTPRAFVADGGRTAQQGSVYTDPYIYEKTLVWGRPIRWQLVADTGYDPYPDALAVRADTITANAPCLRAFVPLLQRAMVAAVADPEPTVRLMNGVSTAQGRGDVVPLEQLVAGVKEAVDDGVVANGDDATLGNFDDAKISEMIAVLGSLARTRTAPLPAGLRASALYTNAFIDRTIGLPTP